MVEIPLSSKYPYYDFVVPVENVTYSIRLSWNARTFKWSLSIGDDTGNIIVSNIVMVTGIFLLNCHKNELLPSGDFMLSPMRDGVLPTRDNLGKDVKLMYFTREEIDAVR